MSTQRDTDYLIRSKLRSFLDGSLSQAAPECPDIGRSPPATHGVKELPTQNSSIGSMISFLPNKKIDLFSKKSNCASSTSSETPHSMMSMSLSNKASSEQDLIDEDFDPSDGREKPISESERLTKTLSNEEIDEYNAISKMKNLPEILAQLKEEDPEFKKALDDSPDYCHENIEDKYLSKCFEHDQSVFTKEDQEELNDILDSVAKVRDLEPPEVSIHQIFTPNYASATNNELVKIYNCRNCNDPHYRRMQRFMACVYDINVVKIAIAIEKTRPNMDDVFFTNLNRRCAEIFFFFNQNKFHKYFLNIVFYKVIEQGFLALYFVL